MDLFGISTALIAVALAYFVGMGLGYALGSHGQRRRVEDYEGTLRAIAAAKYSETGMRYHARCALLKGGAAR